MRRVCCSVANGSKIRSRLCVHVAASMAIEKALGEAVREAIASGVRGRGLAVCSAPEAAESDRDVVEALGETKSVVWRRF